MVINKKIFDNLLRNDGLVPVENETGFIDEIISKIQIGEIPDKQSLHKEKVRACKKYGMARIPPDSFILENLPRLPKEETQWIKSILMKKKVRTISGVAIIAAMTSPHKCPHGKCSYCPGGPPLSPQSYTGEEPAAMRGKMNQFDPFKQTSNRLEQLQAIGHPTDKIELILMGGTFPSRDLSYQRWFAKRCLDAMNGESSSSLQEAMKKNEKAGSRCIGLTVETRPDWCRLRHVDSILEMGCTRVELGVQIINDEILFSVNRKHTVADTIMATRILKDSGLKVCYHLMPGLPGSDEEKDLKSFRKIFEDPRFRPDMLKIYPTLVIKGSGLYKKWKERKYEPLETSEAVKLVARMKKLVPEWVRIQRIDRDVPSPLIRAGVKKSNLRQLVKKEMERKGWKCRCIRCREVGHNAISNDNNELSDNNEIEIKRKDYEASWGKEIFLSIEKDDFLIGYCRLRIPYEPYRPEINGAIIRELRVNGPAVPIGEKGGWQHRGYGKMLVENAEEVSGEFDSKKLLVTSGIGAKEYYRKLGFGDDGVYVSKKL